MEIGDERERGSEGEVGDGIKSDGSLFYPVRFRLTEVVTHVWTPTNRLGGWEVLLNEWAANHSSIENNPRIPWTRSGRNKKVSFWQFVAEEKKGRNEGARKGEVFQQLPPHPAATVGNGTDHQHV